MTSFHPLRFLILASFVAGAATAAKAQQFDSYSFNPQNRAQIAVAMKQIEDADSSSGAGLASGLGATTIVCGGGSSTATANNTCIILNSSTGQVGTNQLSDGDQSSTNSQPVSVNGETITGADDVLSILSQ